MDKRIDDILYSLLSNIGTLDDALMRMHRSEIIYPSEESFGLLERVRDACISTLQATQSIERKLQGATFIIPAHIAATLE